nr:hypothetical protein [Streptomyces sp. WAC05858]
MRQLEFVADQFAGAAQHRGHRAQIGGAVPAAGAVVAGPRLRGAGGRGAVGVGTGDGGLDPDVPEAPFACGGDLAGELFGVPAVDVGAGGGAVPEAAAEEGVQRGAEPLGLQVPPGDVDAAEGVAGDRTADEVRAALRGRQERAYGRDAELVAAPRHPGGLGRRELRLMGCGHALPFR